MSAPLVISLRDGSVWERRAVTREGVALYALAGSCKCPEFVMATYAELEAHGIASTADALPVAGGETSVKAGDRVEITAVQPFEITWDDNGDWCVGEAGVLVSVDASAVVENLASGTFEMAPYRVRLDGGEVVSAAGVRPVPVGPGLRTLDRVEHELTGSNLSLYEEELENARLRLALKSAQRGRREARGLLEITEASRKRWRDAVIASKEELTGLRSRVAELEAQREADHKAWQHDLQAARSEREATAARIAGLEAERHVTNEALDDAAKTLREQRDRIAELESEPLAWAWKLDAKSLDNFLIALGSFSEHEPMDEAIGRIHELLRSYRGATSVDGVTWLLAPTQALREAEAGETAC